MKSMKEKKGLGYTKSRLVADIHVPQGISEGACRVSAASRVRVALCFYGLARNLNLTRASLIVNLVDPLRSTAGAVDVFVHGLLTRLDASNRTKLASRDIQYMPDWTFARPCGLLLEDQVEADTAAKLSEIAAQFAQQQFGYELSTSMNFVRAYYSIGRVAGLVRQQQSRSGMLYSHVVLARPDTGLLAPLPRLPPAGMIAVPNFQHWRGVNDRFAMGDAGAMLRLMSAFATWQRDGVPRELRGVLPEKVRCMLLAGLGVRVQVAPMCIARIRASGQASLCDTAPHPAFCYWEALGKEWPWGREVPKCINKHAGAPSFVNTPADLNNACGDAVSVVRIMHRFGWQPTYVLPMRDGSSE